MAETASTPAAKPARGWIWRLGSFALGGAILGIAIALLAALLARFDAVDKLAGFFWIGRGTIVAVVSGLIGLGVLIVAIWRKKANKTPAIGGLALSVLLVAVIAVQIVPGIGAPPMHDITTDVDDPPEFANWELREDNLRPFNSIEEWRAAHRQNYPDIQPAIINKPPVEVLADARALAEDRGWKILETDAQAGRLEAIAYAGFVRFRDHVVVEVIPIADGSTRVDMRSTSEVGVGDLGYNAERIEEFLGALRNVN